MERDLVARLKTLTDATRLRLVGALAAGPATAEELADRLDLPLQVVVRQLGLLRHHEVVGVRGTAPVAGEAYGRGTAFELRLDTLQALGRRLDELEREAAGVATDAPAPGVGPDGQVLAADDAKVLRAFVVDGRLESIPAQEKKRQVILRYLLDACFAEDRTYPEKEVNQRLALFHPDVAALRRYLVDSKLMTRAGGEYRRAEAAAGEVRSG